jgi:hypothetical protein
MKYNKARLNHSTAHATGEKLDGPRISAVKAVAKQLGLYVVVPFRMQLTAGESYNGAVVVGHDGELVLSTSGVPSHGRWSYSDAAWYILYGESLFEKIY